jgi:hypothetical protein
MKNVTVIFILSSVGLLVCFWTSKKVRREETFPGHDMKKVRFEDIRASEGLFKQAYDLDTAQSSVAHGYDLLLELHRKKDELRDFHTIPQFILLIRSTDGELMLPIDSALFKPASATEIPHYVPKVNWRIFCIANPGGGNGLNANPMYVVSLEDEAFLKNIGKVAAVRDFDGDGVDDLIWYEDVWEAGLYWFGRSWGMELCPKIYYRIEDGRLVRDTKKNMRYWRSEIERLDTEIAEMSEQISKDATAQIAEPECGLLHAILNRLIHYKLLGESEKGWKELSEDLRHCDRQYFFFPILHSEGADGKRRLGKFPIENIEKVAIESLERTEQVRGHLP